MEENYYSKSDVLQAVCAALLFGDMGLGREAFLQDSTDLGLFCGLTIRLDKGARDLLREAQYVIDTHGGASLGMYRDLPLTTHDLTRAIPQQAQAPQQTCKVGLTRCNPACGLYPDCDEIHE